jgi:hypothetical protein
MSLRLRRVYRDGGVHRASVHRASVHRAGVAGTLVAIVGALALSASALAAVPAPSVSTSGVSSTTYSSTTLSGYVNPHGQLTNFVFEYGPTSIYGLQTPLAPAGSGNSSVKVSQPLVGLRPDTTYHYRIVAASPGGTIKGADRTFKTPKIPLSLQLTGVPNPVQFGRPVLVEGTLVGTGAANREVVLQTNPFPYSAGFQDTGNAELTTATGTFAFPFASITQNTQLRVVSVGNPIVISPVVTENVAVRVIFHVRHTHRKGYARLYGTVTPGQVGARVGFQLLVRGGRTVNQGGTAVKVGSPTSSTFSRVVHIRRPGVYRALVQVPSTEGAHVSNYSAPILIR